jgi:hypothetical protein
MVVLGCFHDQTGSAPHRLPPRIGNSRLNSITECDSDTANSDSIVGHAGDTGKIKVTACLMAVRAWRRWHCGYA